MVSKKVLSSSTSNTVFMPGDLEGAGADLSRTGTLILRCCKHHLHAERPQPGRGSTLPSCHE
jgi:hypothetical protein